MRWRVRLDHAAVATHDPQKLKRVLALLGLDDEGSEPVPSQGVITHFSKPAASEPRIEILESTDPNGVVAKFLEKKGPGIHHLSFMIEEGTLETLEQSLRTNSIRLVYKTPQVGAHHTRVNFIHPESTGGILIEIAEKTHT